MPAGVDSTRFRWDRKASVLAGADVTRARRFLSAGLELRCDDGFDELGDGTGPGAGDVAMGGAVSVAISAAGLTRTADSPAGTSISGADALAVLSIVIASSSRNGHSEKPRTVR
jgi:hypothetical protein